MSRLVMKFGGTSVATLERIAHVARHVKREVEHGHQVVVVVSAMAGKTNELVGLCEAITPGFDRKEYDVVVSAGEQISSGLLAITLQNKGVNARSFQGWQVPVITNDIAGSARIKDIQPENLIHALEDGQVCVVAGFQGRSDSGRVATLGRGGSDTSAVAMAAAVKADRCDIYTDVDGIYTTDPRIVAKAQRLNKISFEEMLEMASLGAKVMQVRSVELAMAHNVPTFVRSSYDDPETIGDNPVGTLICAEEDIVEAQIVTGIAFSKDEAQLSVRRVPDRPGAAANVFVPLADANINVDMIVQTISADGASTDMTFTVPSADYNAARAVLSENKDQIGFEVLDGSEDVCKISVIGVGMRSHAGVAAKAFKALAEKGINIRAITTSEIKISFLIDAEYTELAVRLLHSLYGLDKQV